MIVRRKDHRRLLDPAELRDIRNRENRDGRPYSDTDMLLDHIELMECPGCRNAQSMTGVECMWHGKVPRL